MGGFSECSISDWNKGQQSASSDLVVPALPDPETSGDRGQAQRVEENKLGGESVKAFLKVGRGSLKDWLCRDTSE